MLGYLIFSVFLCTGLGYGVVLNLVRWENLYEFSKQQYPPALSMPAKERYLIKKRIEFYALAVVTIPFVVTALLNESYFAVVCLGVGLVIGCIDPFEKAFNSEQGDQQELVQHLREKGEVL